MITIEEKAEVLDSLLRTIVDTIGKKTPLPMIEHIEKEALFRLQIDGQDVGRFVGKDGLHIWSIQTLFWYAGLAQVGYSYSIKLLEPEVSFKNRGPVPFRFNPDWDREKIKNLISKIILSCVPGHASYTFQEESETSAVAKLKITKYLQRNMEDPSFVEAFSTVLRAAGMSQCVSIKTEATFE
jgi:predicted RNA-binding protein YlqC (UPF0109 family)